MTGDMIWAGLIAAAGWHFSNVTPYVLQTRHRWGWLAACLWMWAQSFAGLVRGDLDTVAGAITALLNLFAAALFADAAWTTAKSLYRSRKAAQLR